MNKHFLLLFLLICLPTTAQDSTTVEDSTFTSEEKIIVGVTETQPFVVIEGNEFSGLSVRSWELVNEELQADYEYRTYPSLQSLLLAVENGEIDLSINPITVTDQRMQRMDFSQPYFISHTGIARKSGSKIWSYVSNILSWKFISALLILLGVIFIFGFLVWLFERRANKEEFGDGPRGILQGFWWSAVTMTTVGYGDKSPRTLGGRVIGFIWMFMAIIMISSLTAGIASSLTVHNMQSEITSIQDLGRFKVTTVQSSSAHELLEQYGVETRLVSSVEEGFEQLRNGDVELFIYDQPILSFYIEQQELTDDFEVLERTLRKDYYSYCFPNESGLLETINPILVRTLRTMEWNNLVKDYK